MLLWDGACIVHEEFRARGIANMKALYPDAAVLVHPESPESVVDIADAVGSTSQLIKAAQTLPNQRLIVATDRGIFTRCSKLCQIKFWWKHRLRVREQPVVHVHIAHGWQ